MSVAAILDLCPPIDFVFNRPVPPTCPDFEANVEKVLEKNSRIENGKVYSQRNILAAIFTFEIPRLEEFGNSIVLVKNPENIFDVTKLVGIRNGLVLVEEHLFAARVSYNNIAITRTVDPEKCNSLKIVYQSVLNTLKTPPPVWGQ